MSSSRVTPVQDSVTPCRSTRFSATPIPLTSKILREAASQGRTTSLPPVLPLWSPSLADQRVVHCSLHSPRHTLHGPLLPRWFRAWYARNATAAWPSTHEPRVNRQRRRKGRGRTAGRGRCRARTEKVEEERRRRVEREHVAQNECCVLVVRVRSGLGHLESVMETLLVSLNMRN